jgi:hypothetical protein
MQDRDALSQSNSLDRCPAPGACGRCPWWNHLDSYVVEKSDLPLTECKGCPHENIMRVMIQQYRSRRPSWWVVDGIVTVPVWVQERLQNWFWTKI